MGFLLILCVGYLFLKFVHIVTQWLWSCVFPPKAQTMVIEHRHSYDSGPSGGGGIPVKPRIDDEVVVARTLRDQISAEMHGKRWRGEVDIPGGLLKRSLVSDEDTKEGWISPMLKSWSEDSSS